MQTCIVGGSKLKLTGWKPKHRLHGDHAQGQTAIWELKLWLVLGDSAKISTC